MKHLDLYAYVRHAVMVSGMSRSAAARLFGKCNPLKFTIIQCLSCLANLLGYKKIHQSQKKFRQNPKEAIAYSNIGYGEPLKLGWNC